MNTKNLYPLACKPEWKEKIWGSESWLLSGLEQDVSVIDNGFLKGNTINEVLEIYLTDLVGTTVYEACGDEFPLLIKQLNVNDFLSVQVHPDNERAAEMHHAYGKTEMWYVMDAQPDARLYLGFNQDMTPALLYEHCTKGTLPEVMNCITPKKGECYYLPAGLIHACGGGVTLAEVQQVSDITYRIYDWGREHNVQTAREMHLDLAIDCIDYKKHIPAPTTEGELVNSPYFTVRLGELEGSREVDGSYSDQFMVYMPLEGDLSITADGQLYKPSEKGCLLIPASLDYWKLMSTEKTKFLEITR
ncbi:MAG: mannose-6-phosphate isomerase [Bacteroidales bacterium]|nr:mannose-6-phosphate isomerase [Bacteroidales bacterium]